MSNRNQHWGKRFGFIHKDGTPAFVVRQLGSGPSISGPHQLGAVPGSPRAKQAAADAEAYRLRVAMYGRPVLHVTH